MRFNGIHTTILCITILGSFLDTTYAATSDAAAIETAVVEFHDALNVLFKGDAGPMKTLWSHANDTTYMGPMGDFDLGWSAISSLLDEQAKLQLGGKVVAENIHVAASPSLAVTHYNGAWFEHH